MGRLVITERNQQHTSLLLTMNTLAHVSGKERKHKLIQSSEVVSVITFFRANIQRCGEQVGPAPPSSHQRPAR